MDFRSEDGAGRIRVFNPIMEALGQSLGGRKEPPTENELGLDEIGPIEERMTLAADRLNVAEEAVEERMGHEKH